MANVDTSLYDTTCTRVNRENTRWKIWLIYTHSPTRVNEWEEFLPIRAWEVILPIAQKRFRGKINGKKNFPLVALCFGNLWINIDFTLKKRLQSLVLS